MILVLSLNSALDKTYLLPAFRVGGMNRPRTELAMAGGKGINVARVLKRLGQPVRLLGCTAGKTGAQIRELVEDEGISAEWIEVRGESRQCLAMLAPGEAPTELNEAGPTFTKADVDRIRKRVRELLPRVKVLVCSGSLPPGVPDDFYADLIWLARSKKVLAALDTSGPALREGLSAGPRLAKPNEEEVRFLTGSSASHAESLDALLRGGAETAVVTLGAKGLVAGDGTNRWHLSPPKLAAVSAIGSGDTLLAGLLGSWRTGLTMDRALKEAAAMAAANTLMPGAGLYREADRKKILPKIRLKTF